MSKGLEVLENIRTLFIGSPIDLSQQLNSIEKELKALEIIKEKLSPLARATFYPMTKEEYDLLEEVLNG